MQDWLQAQMANGFAAFTGAVVTASIPVKDSLVNELLASYLTATRSETAPIAAPRSFDPRRLLPLVRTATVRADDGVLTLHVEFAVDASPPR